MEYKLIATDMDGTLLNDSHQVTEKNVEAIRKVQEKGIKFVLASGRPTFAMHKFAEILNMKENGGYLISFNGGQIVDLATNETIFHQGFDRKDIELLYNEAMEMGMSFILYGSDTIYGNELNEYTGVEYELTGMKFEKIDSLADLDKFGIERTTKCMILGSPEEVKKAEVRMKEKYGNKYFIATSKPIFLEVANVLVNKGKTLKKLGELLGISTEEMIAVGDSGNDAALLETVGMPVAVENATPEIKELSKFVVRENNDDALDDVIHHFYEIK